MLLKVGMMLAIYKSMKQTYENKIGDITIWTEGGEGVGMGHFIRSLNVASALKRMDLNVNFLVNNNSSILDKLNEEGFSYSISGRSNIKKAAGVVVIDSSREVESEVRFLKEKGNNVVLIDNDTDACRLADMVIKPSMIDSTTGNMFRGKDFITIGENFFNARHTRAVLKHSKPFKVLITLGESDPYHITDQVLESIMAVEGLEITVVVGTFARPSEKLMELELKCGSNVSFFYGVKDIAPLMTINHIGITTMGSTMFELGYMGLPSIVITNKRNEVDELEMIKDVGIGLPLGYYQDVSKDNIRETVELYMNNVHLWDATSERARRLYDGQGAVRIADVLNSLTPSIKSN